MHTFSHQLECVTVNYTSTHTVMDLSTYSDGNTNLLFVFLSAKFIFINAATVSYRTTKWRLYAQLTGTWLSGFWLAWPASESFPSLEFLFTPNYMLHVNGAWSVGVVKGLKLTLLHKTTWFVWWRQERAKLLKRFPTRLPSTTSCIRTITCSLAALLLPLSQWRVSTTCSGHRLM